MAVVAPPAFEAVTVWVVSGEADDGVPESTPVFVFRVSPAGRGGVIDQVATSPSTSGVRGSMGSPSISDRVAP